jgi:RNA polymerase sigma factor (sigma-70 family)
VRVVEDDDQLGRRLAAGEESAVADCYARYGPTVLVYLRRHVGPDEAEDVLQRTFVDLWQHARRYDPERSLSGWVFTIARRRAIDALRRRKPAVVPLDALRDLVGDDGREVAERFAWAADVRAALAHLPDVQRETLEMAYFADRTQTDIARLMDVPLGTVKARMARGTRALGALLAEPATPGEQDADDARGARRVSDEGGARE